MKRILFVAEAVTLAQVVRLLTLARALPPTEFDVHFASAPLRWPGMDLRGLTLHVLASRSPAQLERSLRRGDRLYSRRTLAGYLEDDLRLLDQVEPDLVVGDLRWTLPGAARLRGIPAATLINAYWSPHAVRERFPVPHHPLVRLMGEDLVARGLPLAMPWVLRQFARPLDAVRASRGLPALGDLLHVLTDGTEVLYPDVPELVPTRDLPAHHHFLGPVLWEPEVPLPPDWPPPRGAPVVYVTLGSSGASELLPGILAELGRLPVQLVVATAGRLRPATVPPNALVTEFLPGSEAVGRAGVVVTNGGSSTGYQALFRGRPVVGVPWNLDQLLASQIIEAAGAGASVRATPKGIRSIAALVDAALGGAWAEGAERARVALGRLDSAERFVARVRHALRAAPSSSS